MAFSDEGPYLELRVEGKEDPYPTLLDVTSFLYDFNLLYEFSRLAVDPRYADYKFTPEYSWMRNNRPLEDADRLHLVELRHQSPIAFIVIVAAVPSAVAAVWGMLQIVEKVVDWPVDREKKRLELEKLRGDLKSANLSPFQDEQSYRDHLRERNATSFIDRTAERLRISPIKIREIEVSVRPQLPPPDSDE